MKSPVLLPPHTTVRTEMTNKTIALIFLVLSVMLLVTCVWVQAPLYSIFSGVCVGLAARVYADAKDTK